MQNQNHIKSVLVTGGLGFLGQAVAHRFKHLGAKIVGLGRGEAGSPATRIYDRWVQSDVTKAALEQLAQPFDVVVHCAGQSSVARSIEQPLDDFRANVETVAELLEYLRCNNPHALFMQASTAGVYGAAGDQPLPITDRPNPVSPYGFHKLMAETLMQNYRAVYGLRCIAIRFFSIYGPGLRRQLLWDAANRLSAGDAKAVFWGSGEETRDWIHVDDAAKLVTVLVDAPEDLVVINGASGNRVTVADTMEQLRTALGSGTAIEFNGKTKPGDPLYYHADMSEADRIGWRPTISLNDGLCDYARWFVENR